MLFSSTVIPWFQDPVHGCSHPLNQALHICGFYISYVKITYNYYFMQVRFVQICLYVYQLLCISNFPSEVTLLFPEIQSLEFLSVKVCFSTWKILSHCLLTSIDCWKKSVFSLIILLQIMSFFLQLLLKASYYLQFNFTELHF